MFFNGVCLAGYTGSTAQTPVGIDTILQLEIQGGIFDHLYISSDTSHYLSDVIPTEWGYDTIMSAGFNGNLVGGNVDYIATQVRCIRIKRRQKGEYAWLTLFEVPIGTALDFAFNRYDRYAANNREYEYALVPVVNDIEGSYSIGTVTSRFHGCYLFEKEEGYQTELDVSKGTISRNRQTNVVQPLAGRYPFVIGNGDSDYYSGSFRAMFLPRLETHYFTKEGAYAFREGLMRFLNNKRPKILKFDDGRIYMVSITDGVKDENDDLADLVHTSFSWTEIGDAESSADLYFNNFIDVNLEA